MKGLFRPAGRKVWMLRHYRNGRELRVSLRTRDEAEAIRRAREIASKPERERAGDYLDEIEKYFAEARRKDTLSRNTVAMRRKTLQRFFEQAGRQRVALVTAADAQAYYDRQNDITEDTRQSYVAVLRAFFGWLKPRVPVNPFASVQMNRLRPTARKRTLTRAQVDTLIAECRDDALRFVLFCGFHAGMRKEEVIEARPEWFDLASGHVHIGPTPTWIPKDRERRSVPLSPSFRLFLAGYGLPSPYMLAPKVKRGRARYRYDFRRPFQAHLKACGVRCTFHDARRTFASLLVSAGVSIYKVAKYLGDGVGVVEKHYGHLQADNGELDRVFG